jgi:hypothetical protein
VSEFLEFPQHVVINTRTLFVFHSPKCAFYGQVAADCSTLRQ